MNLQVVRSVSLSRSTGKDGRSYGMVIHVPKSTPLPMLQARNPSFVGQGILPSLGPSLVMTLCRVDDIKDLVRMGLYWPSIQWTHTARFTLGGRQVWSPAKPPDWHGLFLYVPSDVTRHIWSKLPLAPDGEDCPVYHVVYTLVDRTFDMSDEARRSTLHIGAPDAEVRREGGRALRLKSSLKDRAKGGRPASAEPQDLMESDISALVIPLKE